MEKWEYMTTFLEANAKSKEAKEFLKKTVNKKNPPRYLPQAMMPDLNKFGDEGWELVHMEPVAAVGKNGDVRFDNNGRWSNTYFCVFKRRKAAAPTPTVLVAPNLEPTVIPPHE